MRIRLALAVAVSAALIGGCSGDDPDTAPEAGTAPAPSSASISVTPARAGCTPEGAYVGTVTWQTDESRNILIAVGPDDTPFVEDRGTGGEHETGEWVVPGLRFTLSDPSGATLATADAPTGDCEAPAGG